jgi:hypothetical protein
MQNTGRVFQHLMDNFAILGANETHPNFQVKM